MAIKREVSWSAPLVGCLEHGNHHHSVSFLGQKIRQNDFIDVSGHTFVALLKACARVGDVEMVLEMHTQVEALGLPEADLFVGSTLVDVFGKCGRLSEAQQVFRKLRKRNTVTWNALLSSLIYNECSEDALKCLEQMHLEVVSPTPTTYVCALKACGFLRALEKGQALHAEIIRKGLLDNDIVVSSSVVEMYISCGFLENAREVSDKLRVRNVVVWTSLISAYTDHGDTEEAVNCFDQMQVEGISPNAVTFIFCLKACRSIEKVIEFHLEIARRGFLESDLLVGNTLIDTYSKCGAVVKAKEVLYKLPSPNIVSWTALIAGYIEHGCAEEGLVCFQEIQQKGILLNIVVLICGLKACGILQDIEMAQEIDALITKRGCSEDDIFLGSTLVDAYAKCGSLAEAQNVFDRLIARDDAAWTALIAGYADCGYGDEAVSYFEKLRSEGISPNGATFVAVLKACSKMGATGKALEIHNDIQMFGLLERDAIVGNSLVDTYAKCGLLVNAQQVYDKLLVHDIVSCNSLISGYAQLGDCEQALGVFDRVLGEGLKPDMVTFLIVLNTCSRALLVGKSETFFEAMSKDYGIIPAVKHHGCMVDLLGRYGQLDKAVATVKEMPCSPNLVLLLTMLGACRTSENLELAKQTFREAVRVDCNDASAYVLMSQIHAMR